MSNDEDNFLKGLNTSKFLQILLIVTSLSGIGGNFYTNTKLMTRIDVIELIEDKAASKERTSQLELKIASQTERVASFDKRLEIIETQQRAILATLNQLIVKVDAVSGGALRDR